MRIEKTFECRKCHKKRKCVLLYTWIVNRTQEFPYDNGCPFDREHKADWKDVTRPKRMPRKGGKK